MKPFKIILFSKDEAYQKIAELVERFGEQIDSYKHSEFYIKLTTIFLKSGKYFQRVFAGIKNIPIFAIPIFREK